MRNHEAVLPRGNAAPMAWSNVILPFAESTGSPLSAGVPEHSTHY